MAANPRSKLKSDDRTRLVVHQAVHGYSGGHRMLESSCPIPAAAERQIDVLSDLSGSTPPAGFDEYLTIYPVAGMQMVAMAKTWLAREMPRPGCVWTHTLLLDFSFARSLSRLRFFTGYFVRPSKKEGFDDYAKALPYPTEDSFPNLDYGPEEHPSFASALVQAWYSTVERKPLVIPAESSRASEYTLLSLWEQQIPAVRTSMSISTGSMADRKIGGRSFDIQVVPRQNVREVVRQCRGVNIEEVVRLFSDNAVGWSADGGEILARDLQQPSGEFRDFLRTLTEPDVGLTDIPIFAEVFSVWFGSVELNRKIFRLWEVIASTFPGKEQGASLKAVFFGNRTGILKGEAETLMLHALLLPNRPVGFLDFGALHIPERCAALANSDVGAAMNLLDAVSRSRRPSEILIESFNALLDAVPAHTLLHFLERNRPLLRDILGRRPELIGEPQFWSLFADSRHEVVAVIAATTKFSPQLAELLVVVFRLPEAPDLAETFADRGTDANLAFLLPVAFNANEVRAEVFERFLRRRMETVLAICVRQPALPVPFMLATSWVVPPSWSGNARFPFAAWAASLSELNNLPHQEKIRVCAFSVAMAFSWKAPESVDLLRFCFSPVYLEAKADRIDYQSWGLIEPVVPTIWGRGYWDRCERMRRAVLARVAQGLWPAALLVLISGDRETLSALIKTAWEQGYQSIFPQLLHSMDTVASKLSEQERLSVLRELSV